MSTKEEEEVWCHICSCDLSKTENHIRFVFSPKKRPDGDIICEECNNKKKEPRPPPKKIEYKNCVICYEDKSLWNFGINCKTCKNSMCLLCCCEYSLANPHFECKGDETGTCAIVKIPCPLCRTINEFCN
jgi:hypothetical protein